MSDIATANTGATPTGSTTATPATTSTPTSPSTSSKGNAMTPGDFKSRLRGTSDKAFETETVVDDPEDVPEEVETNFQAAEEEPETVADEPESETSEEDFSWLEALKEHKQLHGLELVDLVKALAEGRLPEELHDIIKIKLKNGDEEWESPLSKARKEAMLHHDYTNKLQTFAKEKKEYFDDKNEFLEMLQSWKTNPESLLNAMERLEFPILDAAKLLAHRHRELDAMTPRERELYEQKQKLERELEKDKYEQKRQKISEHEASVKIEADKKADFVSIAAKQLFDKHQVPLDERTWRLFLNKFQIISNSFPPGTAWTIDMIENAFEATHYDYQQALVKREGAQKTALPQKAPQKFDSPAREAVARLQQTAPAPKKGVKGGALKPADFRKQFLGR